MTEPVNNEWIDELLDAIWNEACDSMEDGGTADLTINQAKSAILSKLESIEQEARKDEWAKIHTQYQKGQIKGQYKILEAVRRVGKNTKFRVACIDCGGQMFRYANKFELNHKHCVAENFTEGKG